MRYTLTAGSHSYPSKCVLGGLRLSLYYSSNINAMELNLLAQLAEYVKRAEAEAVSAPNALSNLMDDYAHDGEYWESINPKS